MPGLPVVRLCVVAAVMAACLVHGAATADEARTMSVRLTWGGGQPRGWTGRIALVTDRDGVAEAAVAPVWRTLCLEPDAAAFVHEQGAELRIHQPRPIGLDGVEIDVADPRGVRLRVEIGPLRGGQPPVTIDTLLSDILVGPVVRPLDDEGNRLTVKMAPGEPLRVALAPVAGDVSGQPPGGRSVPRPGEQVRCTVDPFLPVTRDSTAVVELRMRLLGGGGTDELAAQTTTLVPRVSSPVDGVAADRWVWFEPVVFDVALPNEEGVYEVVLDAVERGGLRWARAVSQRTIQLPAVGTAPPADGADATWEVIHELDPGSPKLHERLRRLPAVGLGDVPLPSMSLPAMPLPSFTRPNLPLPRLPSVPTLPVVGALPSSLSSISSMVPRLGGLLATGHSRVEPHPLGPMLRLPPAPTATAPTWEGIVVAGVTPGSPHLVEIEYPADQDAALAVTVLEPDAADATVVQRYTGGIEVRRPMFETGGAALDTHRFVFWPTTRHPLLVIANADLRRAALLGKVRVLGGPSRLPAATTADGRGIHAFLPSPALTGFGAAQRKESDGGRASPDWNTHLTAIDRSAQMLRGRAAAGALVTVFTRGAALWPSPHTRAAALWDPGRAGDEGLDATAKDILEVLCRVYDRAGLRLVPAVSFDAPLPALEAILGQGGDEATGIVCVGGDGRPPREGRGSHYNVLDPRVQQAVEDVVGDLAARLTDQSAVDGAAVLMPADGWLHLPGVAWGLDDATFGRFLGTVAAAPPSASSADLAALSTLSPRDGARFALRARLVQGPLREAWLAWRADEVARFHARLAARVVGDARAGTAGGRRLWVVPTTLLTDGDPAERFRPTLEPDAGEDPFLPLGLDPARLTADPRVVFVAPHVSRGGGLRGREAVDAANRAAARSSAAAARRGVVVIGRSQPLPLAAVVPHGPFGSATARADWRTQVVVAGAERGRPLAEALAVADAERVFDTSLSWTAAEPGATVLPEWAAVPNVSLETVPVEGGPLVVRRGVVDEATWVQVIHPVPVAGRVVLDVAAPRQGGAFGVAPQPSGAVTIDVEAWDVRAVRLDGAVAVTAARIEYPDTIERQVEARMTRLRRLRAALETPAPVAVLDNPGFELGGGPGASPAAVVTGWELVEPRRGTLAVVPGIAAAGSRAVAFGSRHGLSTLRSNPFNPPQSGRISIAAWLRIREGDPQPPLRLALEGVRDNQEYYRFAAVGGLAGGRPLSGAWSQFVLQVDDLPDAGLDSLRVRFDLLGPGTVEIDEVRVFDLAFDERQREQLTAMVSSLDRLLDEGNLGGCLAGLDTHWPRFLEAHVPDGEPRAAAAPESPKRGRAGVMDRVRRLWQ